MGLVGRAAVDLSHQAKSWGSEGIQQWLGTAGPWSCRGPSIGAR
jgi:hypothetical protein